MQTITHTFSEINAALREASIYRETHLISFRPYIEASERFGFTILYYMGKGEGEYVSHRLYISKTGNRTPTLESGHYHMVVHSSHDEALAEALESYLAR